MKVFSGIASCRRINSSSSAARKRKPPEPTIRILATSLWSALVTRSIQPARLGRGKPSTAISGRGSCVMLILVSASFAADDVFDHVSRDVGDFFFRQDAFERRHAAAAVRDLFFGAGLFFGFRHRRQVRTAVAAVAGGAVADRALFGEDFFARFRVRGAARFGRFFTAAFFRRFFGFRFFAAGRFFGFFCFFAFSARFALGVGGFFFFEFFGLDFLGRFVPGLDALLLFLDEFFEAFRRDDFDRGPHRRVGLAREGGGLAGEFALGVGAEEDMGVLARDRVHLGCQVGDAPRMDDVGRFEFQFDRGVDRDHQLPVAEGTVRVVVAPQPLLAGRLDHQRLAFEVLAVQRGEPGGGRLRGRERVAGEDDAQHEEDDCEAREGARDAQLQARLSGHGGGRSAAPAAPTSDRAEQSEVDRDDNQEGGEEADPNERVYLAGARRVRRQGGAILITASGHDAVRPARVESAPTYTRRPYEEALPATPRDTAGCQGVGDGHRGRGDRPSAGTKAPPRPRLGDPRGGRLGPARGRRPRPADA